MKLSYHIIYCLSIMMRRLQSTMWQLPSAIFAVTERAACVIWSYCRPQGSLVRLRLRIQIFVNNFNLVSKICASLQSKYLRKYAKKIEQNDSTTRHLY